MPELLITRKKQFAGRFRTVTIFIDSTEHSAVRAGESLIVNLPVGVHTVTAKIDWSVTPQHQINISENCQSQIVLQSPFLIHPRKLFLTFGRYAITLALFAYFLMQKNYIGVCCVIFGSLFFDVLTFFFDRKNSILRYLLGNENFLEFV